MCGRYNLLKDPLKWIGEPVIPGLRGPWTAEYNIAPHGNHPVFRRHESGKLELVPMRWGFLPRWATPEKNLRPQINARAEEAAEKPMFRASMKDRRCLVPATGFYEWKDAGGGKKVPYHIHLGGKPFLMAALWDDGAGTEAEREASYAILTTRANAAVEPLHDRMPVIIPLEKKDAWLDDPDDRLLLPAPAEAFRVEQVSTRINKATSEGPYVLQPPEIDQGDA